MYTLKRDGEVIAQGGVDWDIAAWIHKHASYSVSWACKYEGYTIEKDGVDITRNYI